MEVIIILPGTSLPEDHNSAEDNPISTDYKLPEEVAVGVPVVEVAEVVPEVEVAEAVPEVVADAWEEVVQDNQEISAGV